MIRRPLFLGITAFCAAILIQYFFGNAAALGVLLILIFVCRRSSVLYHKQSLQKHGAVILLIFYAVSAANFQLYQMQSDPFAEFNAAADGNNSKSVEQADLAVSGTVTGSSVRTSGDGEEYLQMTLRAVKIEDAEISRSWYERPVKLLVNFYPNKADLTPVSPGTKLCVTGKAEVPAGQRNPNCFDYGMYLKSIGIERVMTASAIDVKEESKSLQGWLYEGKEAYLHQMKDTAGESAAGFMRGILFGEKTEIAEDTLEEFQRNGTAHILAVSGLHIGILYGVLGKLWRGKKGWLYFWIVTFVLLGYSFLASFSPSVVRASVMIVLHLYAKVKHLRYDLGSASFVVLLLILLRNPMQLFHTGLQMSFLAVLTLSAAMPLLKKFYQGIFLASGAVQLGILPYTAYVFNYVSLASVFVNVPVVFLAGFLVPLGIGGFALNLAQQAEFVLLPDGVIMPLLNILGKIIEGLCQLLTMCNSMTCIEGVTSFDVTGPPRTLLAGYYLLLLLFLSEEGRLLILRKKKKIIAVLIAACLGASAAFGQVTVTGFEKAAIVFVDVGQGDCMHIKTAGGKNYLIDGGGKIDYNLGKKTLRPYLLKNGVRQLDGVFVTHLHTDHYKGAAELCREGMVKKLFLYEGNRDMKDRICRETGMNSENLIFLSAGQTVLLGNESSAERVEVIWPESPEKSGNAASSKQGNKQNSEEGEKDENKTSLILKIHAGNMSLLATGDIDAACEDGLAAKYRSNLKTDLLKVAHHGSRYSWSDAFAEYTDPQAAVFQVGKNNYGHPNDEIIAGYEKNGAAIYRNDRQGAIGFFCGSGASAAEGKRLEVVTMLP